jgi:hypothetical protein
MKQMQEFTHMKKSRPHNIIDNQRGSVINVALLILILIFLVGIGLNKISTTDIKIASNMKTAAETFYETEAGLEGISELLEQNVACPMGFADTTETPPLPAGWERIEGKFMATNLSFWRNDTAGDPTDDGDPGTLDDRDPATNDNIIAYYVGDPGLSDYPLDLDKPHTSFSLGGQTRFSRGSAIQMAAGYEGLGKGAAGGGASIIYDIYAMRYGENGSEAQHMIQWIHKVGFGGICQY